ncbi:unnamed protein product [Cladocopium goreaui]|uniref:Methyltransferase type 11 domain-containing protein n=1 Tax=Cladocopium goreaui TaxID=2562237 RepID=A0A9P1FGK9_9DINO|nr:unnamed protein product [Cladocopium goreaui]
MRCHASFLLLWFLQASSEPWSQSDVEVLANAGTKCGEVHGAVLRVVDLSYVEVREALQQFLDSIPWLLQQLEHMQEDEESGPVYGQLFPNVLSALQLSMKAVQLLGLAAVVHRPCFQSSARLVMGQSLPLLQQALQQQVSTLWWMFDIGKYSNTNSPAKHLQALLRCLQKSEALFAGLQDLLPAELPRSEHFWGHQEHGMFMNSTVIYRTLFPESAIVDKGLLRYLLRLLPPDVSLGDFGALDGQYSRWLNDTGLVTAYAFDGVMGVTEITEGAVTQVDLAEALHIEWHPEPFDWVLCLEVAEHIPPQHEEQFLENLGKHASEGLILPGWTVVILWCPGSWAPPGIEGEGHINCQELEDSRKRVEALGFHQDVAATSALREASQVPWIAASVAVYRRQKKTPDGGRRTRRIL